MLSETTVISTPASTTTSSTTTSTTSTTTTTSTSTTTTNETTEATTVTEPPEEEFHIETAETAPDGTPILNGYSVQYFESEQYEDYQYTIPHYLIAPTQNEQICTEIIQRYRPSWTPEGFKLTDNQNTQEYEKEFEEARNNPDTSPVFYEVPCYGTYDNSFRTILFRQQVLETKAGTITGYRYGETSPGAPNTKFYYWTFDDISGFSNVIINGRPTFIVWSEKSVLEGETVTEYYFDIVWEQDGYLCPLQTSAFPQDYLPELLKMAESIQPE